MSGALRFNRIKVQNVGILGEKVIDLGPLTPGINIISGPNECGKSSIVRALRAALFQRHGSGHASVKALQPHGSKAGPNVEVEFEVDGAAYVLEKQFLKKGFARVRAKDGSLALEGDEADQWLIATLDAREAAKKGSNPDDMGVWGLLWVNQDEFATQEPAERMGEHVRGSLAHAIGSLVGNVMGGAHGVQLRDAIDAEYAAVWTPKQEGRATGKLLGAREDVERLTREVAEFQRKVDDTVKLGDDLLERERDFEEHTTAGGSLQREVDECARAVEQGNAVEKERDAAAVALREASETLARATAVLVQREARRVELAKADELARAQGAVVEQLRAKERRLAADEQVAAREEVAARRDADGIQRTLAEQTQRLEQMRAREELTRLEQDLDEARRLDGLIREDRERLRALPDGEALASIQAVEGKRVEREEYLRRHATRVTVAAPGETPAVHFVALHKTITVGELGSLIVDPPREGFIKANARWRENREQLRARLGAIGVASVSAARTLAERRGALEEELASVRAKLLALAPKGIEALSAEADRADRERADSARAREAATERRDEVTRLEQSIAGVTASDAAVKELEGLEARVRTLIEVEARSAVRVTLRPLAAVLVQVGTRETPRVLTAGVEVRRPIAAPTTITVGGQIEIEIDPGTAVREEGVDAAAAQQELSTRLSAMGFETLEEAQAQAKMRARDEALRDEAERQLKALAPHGVAALGEQGLRRERIAEELRRKVEEARGHAVVIASREQDARDLPITREAFAELDGLDRQCLADEQLARRLAARIVSASGRLASAWEGREDLLDVTEVTAEGVRIEVVPGEVAPDFELPVVERDLQMKLHAIGAASVQDAVAAHVRWGPCTPRWRSDSTRSDGSRPGAWPCSRPRWQPVARVRGRCRLRLVPRGTRWSWRRRSSRSAMRPRWRPWRRPSLAARRRSGSTRMRTPSWSLPRASCIATRRSTTRWRRCCGPRRSRRVMPGSVPRSRAPRQRPHGAALGTKRRSGRGRWRCRRCGARIWSARSGCCWSTDSARRRCSRSSTWPAGGWVRCCPRGTSIGLRRSRPRWRRRRWSWRVWSGRRTRCGCCGRQLRAHTPRRSSG